MKIVCVPASWAVTIRQSKLTRASSRIGEPVTSVVQRPAPKRASPSMPVRPAKRSAISCWPAESRLTARWPVASRSRCASASRLTQARSCGGSAETEQTAVAVRPAFVPSPAVVTNVTPAASCRMPAVNRA